MTSRPRKCPYQHRHEPHTWTSGWQDAQCDGRPEAPQEPEGLPPELARDLTRRVSDILDEHPEHNTDAEHEHVVNQIVTTVLKATGH